MYEQNFVDGLPMIKNVDDICESCIVRKQHRDSFPKGKTRRASKLAELIHVDVCGPMTTYSLNNNKYFSQMTWVNFLKEKS